MNPGVICFDCEGAKHEPSYRDAVLSSGLHEDLSECSNAEPVENPNQVIDSFGETENE